MSNRRLILNIYKSKLKLCHDFGYEYGNYHYYVKPNYNLRRSLKIVNKMKNENKRITYIANHIRQSYKDQKNIRDPELINLCIDKGLRVLRKIDDLLF